MTDKKPNILKEKKLITKKAHPVRRKSVVTRVLISHTKFIYTGIQVKNNSIEVKPKKIMHKSSLTVINELVQVLREDFEVKIISKKLMGRRNKSKKVK